ncbi:MAG: N-acetyl-gamma-glutamyl-phosphate reductase [Microthrixaceae bacterium]
MARVGVIGASGYTGAELLRLIAGHDDLELGFATGETQAGESIGALYPSLAAAYRGRTFERYEEAMLGGVDGVFVALPHGHSQSLMGPILASGAAVVDLGADFRLRSVSAYEQWYGETHTAPELLGEFAYGLTELYRDEIKGSRAVANPGCYPSAANLALAPLVRAGLVEVDSIVVNAVSGVSGAGRPPKPNTTFCAVEGDVSAYGLVSHRHTSEIDMVLGATVLFTPHLVPMNRGILATCTAKPTESARDSEALGDAGLLSTMAEFYADEPFIVVSQRSPSTKATLGSNAVHLTCRYDPRTDTVLAIAALDNLTKGASGAAVQNMNIVLGLEEAAGLGVTGLYP